MFCVNLGVIHAYHGVTIHAINRVLCLMFSGRAMIHKGTVSHHALIFASGAITNHFINNIFKSTHNTANFIFLVFGILAKVAYSNPQNFWEQHSCFSWALNQA